MIKDFRDYNLLPHNTFGIEARCRRFVEFESVDEAREVATMLQEADEPLLIVGGGSNLLLTGDYQGTVVHSAIKGIREERGTSQESGDGSQEVILTCGSGETWDDVVAYCVERGYYGAENLSLIPGEVGASAVQNIGAYGAEVADIIRDDAAREGRPVGENPAFNPRRDRPVHLRDLSHEERDALIAERPEYGRIVCRCEGITEGEILDVLHAPIVPRSIDAIKRRCRAGMGRCQGGFCQPRVLEILARELGCDPTEVCLHGPGSEVLRCDSRDGSGEVSDHA